MSNSFFQFRQFCIHQEHCAMKVSTDACIQGAWTPVPQGAAQVLDIGCGTGLLSLMVTQRNNDLQTDAVEIDANAAIQARANCAESPFARQVSVFNADIRNWDNGKRYDLVICNPPFFSNSLKGDTHERNLARHDTHFSLADMAMVLQRMLAPGAYASILLPDTARQHWEKQLSQSGLHLLQRLSIRPFAHSRVNRIISICSTTPIAAIQDEELVIYDSPGQYTEVFRDLMRPYYLYL